MVPSSFTKAKRSTSGSTTIPRSAPSFFMTSVISVRWAGRGSGLCANSPFISPLRTIISVTPNCFNKSGTYSAPLLLIPSTTTLNPFFEIASLSTKSCARMSSKCLCLYSVLISTLPKLSTSTNEKSLALPKSNTFCPTSALINSPVSSSSFSAFHCFGL